MKKTSRSPQQKTRFEYLFEDHSACKLPNLVKSAIEAAVKAALKIKPVNFHCDGNVFEVFIIDGEAYSLEESVKKLMGKYSWWTN